MSFRSDFIWGVATASYQVEGAPSEDGKGPSVWDEFCRVPGSVYQNETGDAACDHYHRWREDVALMKRIGLKAYRFSVSWPRILPEGTGRINEAGLRFYENLIDELVDSGITPFVTLFHWDYPAALQKQGGWLNPASPRWFRDYARLVAERFAGKVKYYFTLNEPQCFLGMGHGLGLHAPGLRLSPPDLMLAVHHVLLAHGLAVGALREYGGDGLKIGLAQCGAVRFPASDSAQDEAAARRAMFDIPDSPADVLGGVPLWSDPIFRGEYPELLFRKYGAWMPEIGPDDRKIISSPIDFFGQNIYTGTPVAADGDGYRAVPYPTGTPKSAMGWPCVPQCMYWGPKFLYEAYGKPVVIAENGISALDDVSLDGGVHDAERINYTRRHLLALRRAAEEGADVAGYFHWSLMDNFEWQHGYNERFGLVYVDYRTQRRIPKDSAAWYGEVIRLNGENL